MRLWRGFGVSVAGSHFSDAGTAQVSASVPNPIAFNQPRQISGPAPVTHTETAAHVDASYWMQATPQLSVIVYGGPSFMHVAQDFVTDVTYTETFPYTTATYQGADTMREHGSVTGFNVGGEAGYRIFGGLSVVGAVRYSHAHVSFTDALADPMPIGGVHVGGGVRFGF